MPDYIPASDSNFDAWQASFVSSAHDHMDSLGLSTSDLEPIDTHQAQWNAAFSQHLAARNSARGARETKDDARRDYEAAIRPLVRRLQANSEVSNAERAILGINIPSDPTPAPVPNTRPVAMVVNSGQRLEHTITFSDERTPTRRAKPTGIVGAEVWVAVGIVGEGALPAMSQYGFRGLEGRARSKVHFEPADGGKMAHYILRWVNTRGEKGPWSAVVSATVGA